MKDLFPALANLKLGTSNNKLISPTYFAITGMETASDMALITSQWTGC